jgi:hypothetical protein
VLRHCLREGKMDKKVTLTFTVQEINLILGSLGKQPFEVVNDILTRIANEAKAQLELADAEAPSPTE